MKKSKKEGISGKENAQIRNREYVKEAIQEKNKQTKQRKKTNKQTKTPLQSTFYTSANVRYELGHVLPLPLFWNLYSYINYICISSLLRRIE